MLVLALSEPPPLVYEVSAHGSDDGDWPAEARYRSWQERFRHANERLRGLLVDAGTTDYRQRSFLLRVPDERCMAKLKATLDESKTPTSRPSTTSSFLGISRWILGISRWMAKNTIEENGRYGVVTKESL